jgi:hypothetical protein
MTGKSGRAHQEEERRLQGHSLDFYAVFGMPTIEMYSLQYTTDRDSSRGTSMSKYNTLCGCVELPSVISGAVAFMAPTLNIQDVLQPIGPAQYF